MKMASHTEKLRRGLLALAIALPALYVLLATIAIWQDYRTTIHQAESDARNISAALSEHAARTLGEADALLRDAIVEIERRRLSLAPADQQAVHEILVAHLELAPQGASLNAIDAGGWMRASAVDYPFAPIDVRDRQYYSYLSVHPEPELFVSRPIRARSTGKWTIPIARRLNHPDGSLKMILEFGLDMGYFDRFYRSLRLGEKGRLMLVRPDGWVVMETPLTEAIIDRNLTDSMLLTSFRHEHAGVFHANSLEDNAPRIVGYAGASQYPLIAAVGMSRDHVLEPWYKRSVRTGVIGLIAILTLLALLRFLWHRLNELGAAQTSLERQNDALANSNEALGASRRRYQELVDGIDGIVWEADLPEFRFTYVSGNAETISGYPAAEWLSNPRFWHEKLSTGADGKPIEPALATLGPGLLKPLEHRLTTPDGREVWLRSNLMMAGMEHGRLHLRGVTVDITRQKSFEQQLFQAIHVDPLTRLPNRRALMERLTHALAIAAGNRMAVAVMLIDVDNFNRLNDSLGHEHGDEVLCALAERLHRCLGPTDTLARFGGDEFVLLMEEVDHSALRAEQAAKRISAAMRQPFAAAGQELYITLTMGIAIFPQDGEDDQALLRNAETALYRVKAAGRNGWQFFDNSMARHVQRRLDMETAFRRGLEREEFFLHFQPQRSLATGKIVGAEALARWDRRGFGMVPTKEFVPLAEETGLILALGNWVLRAACAQAVAWKREQRLDLRIGVNVAAVQLQQPDFVDQVRRALELSGLPPHRLELEITEGSIVKDVFDVIGKLQQIKAMGVELAIDDFGTGYSSLSYLKQLPFDRLKIDQSFVRDLPHNADDCAIVRTIIAMARNLKLGVIAEGVESQAQLEFLRAEGCDEIQGFFLSPPISADAFALHFPDLAQARAGHSTIG